MMDNDERTNLVDLKLIRETIEPDLSYLLPRQDARSLQSRNCIVSMCHRCDHSCVERVSSADGIYDSRWRKSNERVAYSVCGVSQEDM